MHLLEALNTFVENGTKVLENAKKTLDDGPSATYFVENKLGTLLGLLGAYKQLCLDTNLPNRKAIESKWIELYKDIDLQNAVDDFLRFEDSWNKFVVEIDHKVALGISEGPVLNEGDLFSCDFEFVNVESGETCKLDDKTLFAAGNDHCLVVLLRHFA